MNLQETRPPSEHGVYHEIAGHIVKICVKLSWTTST